MSNFIHLHTHTEFSVVDGICRIPDLIKKTEEHQASAIAMTDQMAMFGAVRFFKKVTEAGRKPILGAELLIEDNMVTNNMPSTVVALCTNEQGYFSLTKLITKAQLENKNDKTGLALIKRSWLTKQTTQGLFLLSGGLTGYISQPLKQERPDIDEAVKRITLLKNAAPDNFALEITRTMRPFEEQALHEIVNIAYDMQIPVVATNDAMFINREDFEVHDVRQMIHNQENALHNARPKRYSREQYLKSPNEMAALFDDIPQAIENSVMIAERCNYQMQLGQNFLPKFPAPEGYKHYDYSAHPEWAMNDHMNQMRTSIREKGLNGVLMDDETIENLIEESRYLTSESWYGLDKRWPTITAFMKKEGKTNSEIDAARIEYQERIMTELRVVNGMGFPGYYLIVKDFIQWGKENDIPVGAGRGSGAGSLVAYCTDITDLDPIPYDLLFERFLNPERVSMPDFDIDFCMERRSEVIDYVSRRYGNDRVAQIATMGSMAAKAAVKDASRALGHHYMVGDRISKLIPTEVGIKLDDAIAAEERLTELYHMDDDAKEIIDYARRLEGITRSIGKHAGGVVISPSDITHFSPLYKESAEAVPVTQYDKNDVEEAGLVKFDFLGLRTLTIIHDAMKHINMRRNFEGKSSMDINTIEMDDIDAFKLLKSAKTTAVFQLESSGMQGIVKKLQPSRFEDIVALVALYRPGPLGSGMVDDFINRKHGRAEVSYPHIDYQLDILKPVLEPTYGIILYQEQVMQIAQVMAGYTLGGADMLRRAMGKKKPEEMEKQRGLFLDGSEANGIDRVLAGNIFDLVEKFAGYGFNKSHSAGYGLLTYQTAFLKAHYPTEFMSAVLSSEASDTDKLVRYIAEVKRMKIQIKSPDINRSELKFIPDGPAILYGLEGIKGVGDAAILHILEERAANGPYTSLVNMIERLDGSKVNKKTYESLIQAGALDNLADGQARDVLLASYTPMLEANKSYMDYREKLTKHIHKMNEALKQVDARLNSRFSKDLTPHIHTASESDPSDYKSALDAMHIHAVEAVYDKLYFAYEEAMQSHEALRKELKLRMPVPLTVTGQYYKAIQKCVTGFNKCPLSKEPIPEAYVDQDMDNLVFSSGAATTLAPTQSIAPIKKNLSNAEIQKMTSQQMQDWLDQAIAFSKEVTKNHPDFKKDLVTSQTNVKQVQWPIDFFDASQTQREILEHEYKALGCYISLHPYELYHDEMNNYISHSLFDIESLDPVEVRKTAQPIPVRISGILTEVTMKKKGRTRYAIIKLDDNHGVRELRLFGQTLSQFESELKRGHLILLNGELVIDNYSKEVSIKPSSVHNLKDIRDRNCKAIIIQMREQSNNEINKRRDESIANIMSEYRNGPVRVIQSIANPETGKRTYVPMNQHRILLRDEMIQELKDLPDVENIKLLGAIDTDRRAKLDQMIRNVMKDSLEANIDKIKTAKPSNDRKRERENLIHNISACF